MKPEVINRITHATKGPFQHLRQLDCCATSAGIQTIAPYITSIETLRVFLDDNPRSDLTSPLNSWLSSLSSCSNLRKLKVFSECSVDINGAELVMLAQGCSELEYLEIGTEFSPFNTEEVTDAHIEEVASLLPRLKALELAFEDYTYFEMRSARSLLALGRHCAELGSITLGGSFDLSLLGTTGPILFPKLCSLRLVELNYTENSSADDYAAAVCYHAPEMNKYWDGFYVKIRTEFAEAVLKAYKRIREGPK